MSEVTRQRKWQLKKMAEGRCKICGQPARRSKYFCVFHTEQHRILSRNYYRAKHGIPIDAPLHHGRPQA